MEIEDIYTRRAIAAAIIENCKHLEPDQPTCTHCIDSAKIALTEDI